MKKRGRVSAAAEAAAVIVDVSRQMPAQAPSELTDGQADVWRRVVGSMPGDFMTKAAHPILIEYCRHVCRAGLLEQQIAAFEVEWTRVDGGLERLDRMLSMAERETRAITACARATVANIRGEGGPTNRQPHRGTTAVGRVTNGFR